jgi:ribosomal protein S18 acetylase RimI-like enzyme
VRTAHRRPVAVCKSTYMRPTARGKLVTTLPVHHGTTTMLQPAHVGHLALLRSLIRQGASDGSFDKELASSSPESEAFFAKLKRALVTGYFVEEGRTGKIDTVAVPGYVYWPDDRHSGTQPAGFGLFRSLEKGYELWLAGVDLGKRGEGHGRALLGALFATPPGQSTYVLRVQRTSRYVYALQHLLVDFGFTVVGDTARLRWFLRVDAPEGLASRVRDVVDAHGTLN